MKPSRFPRVTAHCLCGAFIRVRDDAYVREAIIHTWRETYHRGPEHHPVRGDVAAMSRKRREREVDSVTKARLKEALRHGVPFVLQAPSRDRLRDET